MNPTRARAIYLVRHGETTLNADGKLRGHLDVPLNDHGWAEVDLLALELIPAKPIRIITGPLARACETAGAIAERTGAPVTIDERYIDRSYGEWSGQSKSDVIAQWGSLDDAPGVEPNETVVRRCRAVLEEQLLVEADGPIVLVGHDATNRVLLASIDPNLGPADDIPQRTACRNLLEWDGEAWTVRAIDQKHDDLREAGAER